ncbi:flagellar basal-body MS-ring/collar protein FliF [Salinisphaera sp. Q1T1-3]|uniref:flagellar basal-body MS-ring/collar protein FliF n=1 Tax=Salinisphaera sp. Q1T1-3 TaxID=2321229 RepID=UPI000E735E2B|nr:flagellar basal-body MS-ring/collar protein FliF [Salinisphaera sp. Q1T1-3]RJS95150.1 flagellar basal body M-ring protein FliF [Salinisphaera sp. Q1T1-3]
MSSAEAQASTAGGMADALARLRASPRLALIIGVAAAVAILAALLFWTRSPDYAVLYSGLADRDGGAVLARLDQMQVPYKLSGGGSTIMVPRSRVDHLRLQMAGDGLPKSGGVGFELMDNQPFGVSEFAEKVNYQRALEGELARSIETIDEVTGARVQLAMPKSSVFVRDRKQPKASVVLDLYSGRALTKGQVTAIQNLVASAVPGLPVDAVTVVNGRGHLLSRGDTDQNDADGTRLAYAAQVEKTYQQRIQDLLAPIVGADNVRTQVTADLDFSRRERTSENYTPNNGDKPAAIRSRQTNQKADSGKQDGGIPGALSNQPTPNAPSPINNPATQDNNGAANASPGAAAGNENTPDDTSNGALQSDGALGLNSGGNISSSRSNTTNYELDRTIAHVKNAVGQVQRVSVAVVINENAIGTPGTDDNPGKTGLSPDRMAQIRRLVRGAVGYTESRGDSVDVIQMPFSDASPGPTIPAAAWWRDPALQALAIQTLKYLLLAIVAWLLWRRLIRPLAQRSGLLGDTAPVAGTSAAATTPAPESADPQAESDAAARALRSQRRARHNDAIKDAQEAARQDPRMVAMIVKDWMKEDV